MITEKEATDYFKLLDESGRVRLLQEHTELRRAIGQLLGVPTGEDDWVGRAIDRIRHLRDTESELKRILNAGEALFTEARLKIRHTTCQNCRGSGRTTDHSCCICGGTGLRAL